MIEVYIRQELEKKLAVPVLMEEELELKEFIVIDKIGSGKKNLLVSSKFAFQSYADSLYKASLLNDRLKEALESLIEDSRFSKIKLESDYNFTDSTTKRYRYQAVYEIYHY